MTARSIYSVLRFLGYNEGESERILRNNLMTVYPSSILYSSANYSSWKVLIEQDILKGKEDVTL